MAANNSSIKFGRAFELSVETNSEGSENQNLLTVTNPMTIEFDVMRRNLADSASAHFIVRNLSPKHRQSILFDVLKYGTNDIRNVTLKAGYAQNIPVIFKGRIREAKSYRDGSSFITEVDAFDNGAFAVNTFSNLTFAAGTQQRDVLAKIAGDLSPLGISYGAIGNNYTSKNTRQNSYSGLTIHLLKELSGGTFSIDNNKYFLLDDNEVIQGDIPVISSATGLLSTPIREQGFLTFRMVFEPRLVVNQVFLLNSITAPNYNGPYKVTNLHHRGVFSGAVAGQAITEVGATIPSGDFTLIPGFDS